MRFALPLLASLMVLATPALAQSATPMPLSSENGTLSLDVLGHRISLPAPDWISENAALDEVASTRFFEDGSQARLEIYPRGEGEAFWTSLYGARFSRQANPVLSDFRDIVIDVYGRSCRPDATAFFQLEPDDGDNIPPLGFVCGAYADARPELAGKGEVMVVGFYKADGGMAMVYREWRGDAFDPADTTSWPVRPDVVQAQVGLLKSGPALTLLD